MGMAGNSDWMDQPQDCNMFHPGRTPQDLGKGKNETLLSSVIGVYEYKKYCKLFTYNYLSWDLVGCSKY
jgi:hypothetical protein